MHMQQQMKQQNNQGPDQRRTSREDRQDRPPRDTDRRRSRSRERKRSRDRSDRRNSDGGGRGSDTGSRGSDGARGRRRRTRSRSKDRSRRRDRSRDRSRDRNKDKDRSRRDKEERGSRSSKTEKSSSKEESTNGSKNPPSNSQPPPWAQQTPNPEPMLPREPMDQGPKRFPGFKPNIPDENPAWKQNSFKPVAPMQGPPEPGFFGPNTNAPPGFDGPMGGGPIGGGRLQRPQETCVQVVDMPPNIVYREIRDFFVNQHVLNIKLVCDENGQKTGRAFVKFGSPENKMQALQMSGTFKGNTRFIIQDCTEVDYDRALDSFQPNLEPAVVAIANIPPYANEMDVKRVFHGARIFNVVLTHPGENKAVPSGYVQFSSISERNRAVQASGKVKIDGQEIFISESSFEDIFRTVRALEKQVHSKPPLDEKRPSMIKQDDISGPVVSECILLHGLPSSVNNREILDFFSDIGLIPMHIHIMQDEMGVPVGDAFCEFRNPIEGARALAKNKAILGSKEISAKLVTRQDMEMALNMPKKMLPQHGGPGGPIMMPRNGQEPMRHQMRPPHFMGRPPFDPRNNFVRGPFPRGPMPPHMMGGMRPRPPFHGHGMMNNGPPSGENSVDNFGKPGCVLEITNVPFQADIDEVLGFFSEFELTRQNVIRRFNDMGKPTGDVRVAFNTPQDAQMALSTKFNKKIRDRQIYLNLLS
jgi:RNA recognition motif-containing protein